MEPHGTASSGFAGFHQQSLAIGYPLIGDVPNKTETWHKLFPAALRLNNPFSM